MGVSFGWYAPLHARHHANPHHEDLDPDIAVYEAVFAISDRTAARARGLKRLVIRYQGWLLPLVLPLQAFVLKDRSLRFVLLEKSPRRWLEVALLAVHYTLYFWFFFHFLGTGQAVAVILLQQIVVGSHLSAVFVPNHIGRPIARGNAPDWITAQVGPSRNVVTPPSMDILWGGLNHQIEHHLVPSMSRNLVRRAAPVVRQFLEEQGMAYYETSILDSYREVISSVHRTGKAAAAKPL
jgi:fatty acid desaturase